MSTSAAPEYWFARRFPLGHARQGMAPVHWKGWALSAAFVAVLTAGAFAFAWFGASGNMPEGIALFVFITFIGGMIFISTANAKCDKVRTVADYREDRKRA